MEIKNLNLLNARVYDPLSNINTTLDVFIRDGKILYECDNIDSKNIYTLNLKNHLIVPGFFDLRVHTRIPGNNSCEGIKSISEAAARGGFTDILAMPDTLPAADNPGTIQYIKDRVEKQSLVKMWLTGCLTTGSKGESIAPLGSLKDAGVIAITDCPYSPNNNQIFINSIKYASMFDLPVIEFPFDRSFGSDNFTHESAYSLKLGIGGTPRIAEELAVQRAISISKELDVNIHISSISTINSVQLIRRAKELNFKITTDVSLHHLLLNETAIEGYNTLAKLNPPLREEIDRNALVSGVCDGTIDAVTSAHNPYSLHEKQVEFDIAPSGAIGLEVCFSGLYEVLKKCHKDPLAQILNLLSYSPRRILQLKQNYMKSGATANFTVIALDKPLKYDLALGTSHSENTPLNYKIFSASPILTIADGLIAYKSNNISDLS